MSLLPWVETLILPTADEMTPDETYLGALLGCLEAIRSGTTALMDFMFGVPDIEVHRAVLRAIRDIGAARASWAARRATSTPTAAGATRGSSRSTRCSTRCGQLAREFPSGLPVSSVLPAPGHGAHDDGRTACCRSRSGRAPRAARSRSTWASTRRSAMTAIDRWGVGAFHKGEEIGFLGPDVVAAHCVKLDEAELEIVARTGTQVSYNPVSNAYLGDGIAPITRMLELGIDVSLATDGGACANTEDMLEAMKFGRADPEGRRAGPAGHQRARHPHASRRSAAPGRSGCRADLGALEVGRLADFFLFDPFRLKSVPMHEPIGDARLHGRAVERRHGRDRRQGRARGRPVHDDRRGGVRRGRCTSGRSRCRSASARSGSIEGPALHAVRAYDGSLGQDGAAAKRPSRRRLPIDGACSGRRRPPRSTRPTVPVIYDNCTVITMDAERRIITGAAVAVDGDSIATVGKSAEVRAALPGRRRSATSTAGSCCRASSTGTSTCRRRCCAAAATRCRCGSGWRSGSSSSRATTRAADVQASTASRDRRDDQGRGRRRSSRR